MQQPSFASAATLLAGGMMPSVVPVRVHRLQPIGRSRGHDLVSPKQHQGHGRLVRDAGTTRAKDFTVSGLGFTMSQQHDAVALPQAKPGPGSQIAFGFEQNKIRSFFDFGEPCRCSFGRWCRRYRGNAAKGF